MVPTVAAVDGFAFGGGCEFVLASHYRIGTTTAKVGLPETKLGIFPGWGGALMIIALVLVAALTFVLAGMASMGMPGFSGFPAELTILIGAWKASPWWAVR